MCYYLFYKFYSFSEAAPSRWWSDIKALLAITILQILLLLSFIAYYNAFTKQNLLAGPTHPAEIAGIVFLAVLNYLFFLSNDKWKPYAAEFDQWPKGKNRIGTLIVLLFTVLVFVNLFFSFTL